MHIVASNVGRSLFADRNEYRIAILENPTDVPFITADQPIVNIAAKPYGIEAPGKFDLFYPLSPTKAMLLTGRGSDNHVLDRVLTKISVNLYNWRMAAHSYEEIYGSTAQVLEKIRADMPAIRRCYS